MVALEWVVGQLRPNSDNLESFSELQFSREEALKRVALNRAVIGALGSLRQRWRNLIGPTLNVADKQFQTSLFDACHIASGLKVALASRNPIDT